MDQRLLSALENLGNALEEIASALQSKEEAKTSSVQALKAGDFGKQLQSINIQLQSIKADTQEILKQQKTIQTMSRQKEVKKESPMEEIGKDKKKESALKKGIGTILLIAVAVLAIGMAFKLVGKIDFISVIALGLAMWVVAQAFEKIAKLKLSLRESFITSLTMVTMSIAITMSSWILRRISPVGIIQLLTAAAIAGVFAVIGISLEKIAVGISAFHLILGKKAAWVVPLIMVAIATAITASSHIMRGIVPIGVLQALTAIAIAGVFAIIGLSLQRIATAIVITDKILGKKATWIFPLILVAIATAITFSSWVLQAIVPIGLLQALTAIGISLIFMIIGFTMVEIATAIVLIDKVLGSKKAAWLLPLVLVAIATAITLSSWILAMVEPIGLFQFLTALGIAILFAVMSFFFLPIAVGVTLVDKIVGKGASLLIPLVFVAIAIAIMLSSHILSKTANIKPSQILQITLFGIGLGLVVLAMLPSVLLVGIAAVSGVGAGAIALGVLMVPLIAAAVAISSHIISMGKYTKYPSLGWVLAVGLAMTGFGAAVVGLGFIALTGLGLGAAAIMIGTLMVPLIAKTIVNVDKIISKGKYTKYPSAAWIASVGVSMTIFGAAVVGLGVLSILGFGLGALAIVVGTKMVPKIANTIVEVDKIISRGKYTKYPSAKWIASVGATMTFFGAAVVGLGILAITGFGLGAVAMVAGAIAVLGIAKTIVKVDSIIAQGKYTKYPGAGWAFSVGGLMTVFGLAVLTLGSFIVGSLGLGYVALKAGQKAVKIIAQSIVDVAWIFNRNSSAFKKGPTKEWAKAVSLAIGAFAPVYKMMMTGGIMSLFTGSGPSPKKFAQAIRTISQGIVDAAVFFAGQKTAFQGGPKKEWSEGVGKAIGAFAPVYKILAAEKGLFGTGVSIDGFKRAIIVITNGIIESAKTFSKNKSSFDNYPSKKWADGVGKSIGAFAPVYKILAAEKGLFGTGVSIDKFKKAIIIITNGIIESAKTFAKNKAPFKEGNYPSVKWGQGVGAALKAFTPVFKALSEDTGWFTSGDDVINNMVNGIIRISGAIVGVANKFKSVSDWKSYPTKNWSWNVKLGIGSFLKLINSLGTEEIYYDNVINSATKMVRFAKILHSGRKYFSLNIDPNYMKKVGKNILDFNFIVQKLAEAERGKGVLESVGGAINGMFGKDPISRIATRMVMLAGAYDKLATALIKLGGAMKVLNISDARMLGGITRSIAEGKSIKDDIKTQSASKPINAIKNEIARVREAGGKGGKKFEEKDIIIFKRMDEIIKVLKSIDRSVSSVDEFISDQSEGKYPTSSGTKLF